MLGSGVGIRESSVHTYAFPNSPAWELPRAHFSARSLPLPPLGLCLDGTENEHGEPGLEFQQHFTSPKRLSPVRLEMA
jgi:hypothetical protein